jgi:hypothetical protein|tara:strand:+ start:1663 stop:2040 length:378 start_codon:yes stop_codon:yes gene_type:complete
MVPSVQLETDNGGYDMEVGQKVILNCKVKRKHDCEPTEDVWIIEETKPAGHRIGNSDCPGPWLLIRREAGEDYRWVSLVDDKHFDLSEVIDTDDAPEIEHSYNPIGQAERTLSADPATGKITSLS